MVVVDHDGNDGAGMGSADPKTLPGDHDHAVSRGSSLHTLRTDWRWRQKWGPRQSYAAEMLDAVVAKWIRQRLEQRVTRDSVSEASLIRRVSRVPATPVPRLRL